MTTGLFPMPHRGCRLCQGRESSSNAPSVRNRLPAIPRLVRDKAAGPLPAMPDTVAAYLAYEASQG